MAHRNELGRVGLRDFVIGDQLWGIYERRDDLSRDPILQRGASAQLLSPRLADSVGLRTIEGHDFGSSYARTLASWLETFDAAPPQIAPPGFDERFRWLWRCCLAYCEAGFDTGRISVQQWAFQSG